MGQQRELADHLRPLRQAARAHTGEVIRVVDAKQHAARRVYRREPVQQDELHRLVPEDCLPQRQQRRIGR
jgi:hypothetical protein